MQRFACTQCGKCCNRSPEVQLSEAAALADLFVFRLMFRLYWLPDQLGDYLALGDGAASSSAIFFGKKRLLGAFAIRKFRAKAWRDGRAVRCTKYLMISALPLDTTPGRCRALDENRCGIYHRRPLSCRSVPFHYSRAEALAETDLAAFATTSGYRCDTSETAEVILRDGRIIAPEIRTARSEAIAMAGRDRRWSEAIVRQLNVASSASGSMPSLDEIEANAQFGATTTSMRAAWQVAADCGLICRGECDRLIELQLCAIDRELGRGGCPQEARETLAEMGAEYRRHLNGRSSAG